MQREKMLGTKSVAGIKFNAFRDGRIDYVYISDHELIIIKRRTASTLCQIGIGYDLVNDEAPVNWLKSSFKYENMGVKAALKLLKKQHGHK
jgi:hypothetical protein